MTGTRLLVAGGFSIGDVRTMVPGVADIITEVIAIFLPQRLSRA